MSGICPLCGYNMTADEPVTIGRWNIVPRNGVFYDGRRVVARQSWVGIMLAVARLGGAVITTEALLARISEAERSNTLSSQICQLRRHLDAQGITLPIKGQYKTGGYRWSEAA